MTAPKLFFSDLADGPVSGWEGSAAKGAAVSIWGVDFGASRGTSYVTCCGEDLTADGDYAEWGVINEPAEGEDPNDVYSSARASGSSGGLERITFWLNSTMSLGAGTITVTTAGGSSDSIDFYCRDTGSIYFIARDGNDSNDGLFSSQESGTNGPWLLATKVRDMQAGDVTYFREGVWNETVPGEIALAFFYPSAAPQGIANKSIAMASYPGEFAQIGDEGTRIALYLVYGNSTLSYWTISKFLLRAELIAIRTWAHDRIGSDDNIRVIGNDGSTYYGAGATIGSFGANSTNFCFYGNHFHDGGVNRRGDTASEVLRSNPVYFGGYGVSDNIRVGWNELSWCENGRAQFYGHLPGDRMSNLYVHDNYIHHQGVAGITMGNTDGGDRFLESASFYNNVVAFNGTRADGRGWGADFHQADWEIYNNTFYHNSDGEVVRGWEEHTMPTSLVFRNNILSALAGETYFTYPGVVVNVTFSNNCYYGGLESSIPGVDVDSVEDDPKFMDALSGDFRLRSDSPCRDAGIAVAVSTDYYGLARPQNAIYDIGIDEYDTGDPPNERPVIADVTATPSSGDPPLEVAFSVTASDPDGSIVGFAWDFDDGGSSALQNPTHTYTSAGTYTATVTVTDDVGATAADTVIVTVSSAPLQPPVISDASGTPSSGAAPLTVQFSVTAWDPDGSIVSYAWDFGDGQLSSAQNPGHIYTIARLHTATVTVTDNDGLTDSSSITITVTGVNPTPPTGLSATAGDQQVTLAWDDADPGDSVEGYNVYRSLTSGSGYAQINSETVTPSAYTDSDLTNDTTYYYVITAVREIGDETDYSSEVSATPESAPAPTPPARPAYTGGKSSTEQAANIDQTIATTEHIARRNK